MAQKKKKKSKNKNAAPGKKGRRKRASSPAVVRELLTKLYPVPFPEEIFSVWKMCRKLSPKRPELALFKPLGITLRGPFDVLAGKLADGPPPLPMLVHWRYAMDPPELYTVMVGDSDGLHWGYWFDDPGRAEPVVCHYYGNDTFEITLDGPSLFTAIRAELESRYQSLVEDLEYLKGKEKKACKKERKKLDAFRKKLKGTPAGKGNKRGEAWLEKRFAGRFEKLRGGAIVAQTFDGMGIVVASEMYEPLPISDRALRAELGRGPDPASWYELGKSRLQAGFPGTALKIGRELWAVAGGRDPHERYCYELLREAYDALEREPLAETLRVHAELRDLASVDLLELPADGGARMKPDELRPPSIERIEALRQQNPAEIKLEEVTTPELNAFVSAPWTELTRLHLDLAWHAGYPSAFAPLFSGELTPKLRHLMLIGGDFYDDLVRELVTSKLMGQLQSLDFGYQSISPETRRLLVRNKELFANLHLLPGADLLEDNAPLYNAAQFLRELGHHARGVELLDRAIAAGGDDVDWIAKGLALMDLRRFDDALAAMQRALEFNPEDFSAHYHQAEILRRAGRLEEAMQMVVKARARLEEDDEEVQLSVVEARILCDGDDDDAAVAVAERSIVHVEAMSPKNDARADAEYWMAALCVVIGDIGAALRWLAASATRDPSQKADAETDELFQELWGDARFEAIGA